MQWPSAWKTPGKCHHFIEVFVSVTSDSVMCEMDGIQGWTGSNYYSVSLLLLGLLHAYLAKFVLSNRLLLQFCH